MMTALFTVIVIGVCVLFIIAIARNKAADKSGPAPADPTKTTGDSAR